LPVDDTDCLGQFCGLIFPQLLQGLYLSKRLSAVIFLQEISANLYRVSRNHASATVRSCQGMIKSTVLDAILGGWLRSDKLSMPDDNAQ
jgi:hypothetical protein